MALVIEGGITVGGNVTITAEFINPTTNLIVFYDAGNSMSYSGSGIEFNTTYTGPNLSGNQQYATLDLAGLTGGPWNSGSFSGGAPITWTSQGVSSYWTFDSGSTNYIDSTYQQNAPTLNSPTYTILAVVRPQDFGNGAIVGGDENIFYFNPIGGLNDGPSLIANNAYGPGGVLDTTTAFETNTWYCVAVTYNADTGDMNLYTNGNLVATATGVPSPTHPTGLFWGTLEGELWFTGDMSVCMAWERELSASEIAQYSTVYLSRYAPPATSSALLTALPINDVQLWTVPEGVTSISVVAVGGGGGGTQDEYAIPGADTYLYTNFEVFQTQYTGSGNSVYVDTATNPTVANVLANGSWCALGPAVGANNAVNLVIDVYEDGANTVIVTDNTFYSNAGDAFQFINAVVAAEGGYEINTYWYTQTGNNPGGGPGGPGPRARALVTDGPYGSGGVVDWTSNYPVGGAGAGGYGISGLAWNITQAGAWYYDNNSDVSYQSLTFSNNNLTVTGLIGSNTAQVETTVLGTETLGPNDKIMYSVNISQTSGGIGYCGIGLATYDQNLWDYVGSSGNLGVGYYDDGRVFIDATNVANCAAFNEGGIVDIAVDVDAGFAWFRVAGGLWNNDAGADPATGTNGLDISAITAQGPITLAASPYYDTNTSAGDIITIATSSTFAIPEGFTFVPGTAGAGGTGGQGSGFWGADGTAGTGGAGGGGGVRFEDSGGGGGGTGLYGRGNSGQLGTYSDIASGIALGGYGGSPTDSSGSAGGEATPWNGGRGGWPGGAGGSATGYWMPGNGGAVAYRNNYAVTPGQTLLYQVGVGGQGQNNGGSGANGAIRIVWPGNSRTFPDTNVGPDTVTVPTLAITDYYFPSFNPTGEVDWTITSDGGSEILETGIIWGLPGQDTYTNSADVCDSPSSTAQRKAIRDADNCANPYTTGLTGAQTLSFSPDPNFYNELIDVRVYARNEAGVAYSPTTLTWTPNICLAEGTLITLADGSTKPIELVTMSDSIRVWDFDNAVATSATPLWIKQKQTTLQYNAIYFSDGTELRTIGQHRIFNKQAGRFTYPMTDDTPIGTITVKADGTEVTLVGKTVKYTDVNYYNIITDGGYMNCYAEGILTSLRYNNIYPIADMQYVKDGRVLRDRAEFDGIADRWIDGLRLPEQTTDIKLIKRYVERLENNEDAETLESATPTWQPKENSPWRRQ